MRKIILISESKQFTKAVMELLCKVQQERSLFLVGGFSHTLNYTELSKASGYASKALVGDLIERDQETVDENLLFFKNDCKRQLIKFRVYEENYLYEIENLVNESRFADLLIISNKMFEKSDVVLKRTLNLKQIMHKSECPVLILPENLSVLKRLIIAYDGKKESMFALKQFCYLFPELLDLPAEIVYLNEDEYNDVPKMNLLKEYTMQNFSSINISKISINPKEDFARWASSKKDTLVIAGAYGRTGLFNSFPDSFIDPILEMQQIPVFISHH
ncbi:MAG: hypothetical protein ABIN89_04390 [Chitinophagaceae bacterium]